MAATVEELIFKLVGETRQLRRDMSEASKVIQASMSGSIKAVDKLNESLKDVQDASGDTQSKFRQTGGAANSLSSNVKGLAKSVALLTAGYVSLKGVMGFGRSFIENADKAQLLKGRLALVTDGADDLNKTWRDLAQMSNETFTLIEGNVEVFQRLALFIDKDVASSKQLLDITRLISQSIGISGTTAQEAAGGLIQFSQALAANRLSGQELNSVSEQMPRLLQAIIQGVQDIAPELGITNKNFRKLAEEGILSANLIMLALESQIGKVDTQFQKLPRTVSRAASQLSNDILLMFDDVNRTTGATDALVRAIDELREVIASPEFVNFLTKIVDGFVDLVEALVAGEGTSIAMIDAIVGINTALEAVAGPLGVVIDLFTGLFSIVGKVLGVLFSLDPALSAFGRIGSDVAAGIRVMSGANDNLPSDEQSEGRRKLGIATGGAGSVAGLARSGRSRAEIRADVIKQGLVGPTEKSLLAVQATLAVLKSQNQVIRLNADGHKVAAQQVEIQAVLQRSIARELIPEEIKGLQEILQARQRISDQVVLEGANKGLDREIALRQTLREKGQDAFQLMQLQFQLQDQMSRDLLPREIDQLETKLQLLREQVGLDLGRDVNTRIATEMEFTKAVLAGSDAVEAFAQEQDRLNLLRKAGIDLASEEGQRLLKLLRTLDAYKDINEELLDQQEELNHLLERTGDTIASSFEDAIFQGEKLIDVVKALEQDLLRLVFRSLVTEPLSEALTGALGGGKGGGGGILSFVSDIFRGGLGMGGSSPLGGVSFNQGSGLFDISGMGRRAGGGPIFAGVPTLVGEHGPEIIESNMGAMVTPNSQIQGFGGTKIDININVPRGVDPRGFRKVAGSLAGDIGRQISNGAMRN